MPTASPNPTPTATPASWPAADRITRGNFMEPAVVIDAAGAVHIAATAADNGGIWYATNASGRWASQQVVAPWDADPEMTGSVDEPTIAIDPSDGSVWIAFIYWQCWDCAPNWPDGIFMINNSSGTWSDPVEVGAESGAVYPSLAVREGHVYLAWAGAGDYFHRYGPVGFGTDESGAWAVQQVAKVGAFAHLAVDADGNVGILVGGDSVRYAHQRSNGTFVVERLPGTAGAVGHFAHPVLAIDAGIGGVWAAWTGYIGDQNHRAIFLATRGSDGWSASMPFIQDGDLVGFGVHDGVVHVIANKGGLTYSTDGSGWFVEQIIEASTDLYWGDTSFALLPNGRPIVVIARDEPVASRSGLWFLKGPAV